jgi:outer membrane protein TolC
MNKKSFMKKMTWFLLLYGCTAMAQKPVPPADTAKRVFTNYASATRMVSVSDTTRELTAEEDIKAQLILLALNNPQAVAADANVRIAEIAARKANSSLLSSISIGGNVNEFVVNNSPAASFFPKYNVGLTIPLDLFARTKAEKRTAQEVIVASKAQKQLIAEALKARVLSQYEIYKEKKKLLELQQIAVNDDIASYEKAQKDFKDDIITLDEVNKVYREMITSKGTLVSKEKELNIAIIELEQTIGAPLYTVFVK